MPRACVRLGFTAGRREPAIAARIGEVWARRRAGTRRGLGWQDNGSLTPSALTWMPSAFAEPTWTHLGVNRCARVIEADETRVVLELFKPGD